MKERWKAVDIQALATTGHHSVYRWQRHAGHRVRDDWHVQNVNAYVSRLSGWTQRFKSVATKYLGSCLGWFKMLDRHTPMGCSPPRYWAWPWETETSAAFARRV